MKLVKYKISELAEEAGVTKRTIHYYISKGLLLPPEGTGVNSLYNDEHLKRLRLIKKLQAEYMPLNKIREYIQENADDDTSNIEQAPLLNDRQVYIRENVCNIFEIHYTEENGKKYKDVIENVKKYVSKMLED